MDHNKSEPQTIVVTTGWLNINTGCQNKCAWCYRYQDLLKSAVNMPFEQAQQVVEFMHQLSIHSLIFIGGEPTLYRRLPELVKLAKSLGIPETTVVSNGRRFARSTIVQQYLDAGLDMFSISIHSAEAEVHDRISGVPCWHLTTAGIRNVVRMGGKCSLNVVAGAGNVESIPASLPKLLDLGVDEIIISCAIPRIMDEGVDGSDSLDPHRFAQLAEAVLDSSEKVKILHELPLCVLPPGLFERLGRENRLGYGCHIGSGRGLAVDTDGRVIPCNSFPHHGLIQLFEDGRLKFDAQTFLELWSHDEEVLELRKEANVFRSPACVDCSLWQYCNCGCPLTWGAYDPAIYINANLHAYTGKQLEEWTRVKYNP